jgi:hypothetical protein
MASSVYKPGGQACELFELYTEIFFIFLQHLFLVTFNFYFKLICTNCYTNLFNLNSFFTYIENLNSIRIFFKTIKPLQGTEQCLTH